jgi:glycosyltransferase involved in cell wall biosynthesis
MEAPKLEQTVSRSRPDVDPFRLASLHYWASQAYSLRRFAAARNHRRHIFYLHPQMERRLQRLGFAETERTLLSYGLELDQTNAVPGQTREYDAVWIGRMHRQKGIDDLLATLQYLAQKLPDFRALFIGNLRDSLQPLIAQKNLSQYVEFSGFVSEMEKIRLFKASRCFLMPSKHEGSQRVIGESIIAGTPVVAYDIPNYRPLFGEFVRYAPPFNLTSFQTAAEQTIQAMRSGSNYLEKLDIASFGEENSWEKTQSRFLAALKTTATTPPSTE